MIDGYGSLNTIVYTKYTNLDGKQLIHLSGNVGLFTVYISFAYPKISYLSPSIDVLLRRSVEFGLNEHWKKEALKDTKREYDAKGESLDLAQPPLVSAFTIDDVQGIFALHAFMLFISTLTFAVEIFIHHQKVRHIHLI